MLCLWACVCVYVLGCAFGSVATLPQNFLIPTQSEGMYRICVTNNRSKSKVGHRTFSCDSNHGIKTSAIKKKKRPLFTGQLIVISRVCIALK